MGEIQWKNKFKKQGSGMLEENIFLPFLTLSMKYRCLSVFARIVVLDVVKKGREENIFLLIF